MSIAMKFSFLTQRWLAGLFALVLVLVLVLWLITMLLPFFIHESANGLLPIFLELTV